MSKNIRTFSEGISTHKPAARFSKPALRSRPSFFRNYQEVEVAMGPPNFQKLMKELRAWKKSGKKGPFRAKLKGPKGKIELKVSSVDLSGLNIEPEINRLVREWLPEFIGTKREFISGIKRAWNAGFSTEHMDRVMKTSIRGGTHDWFEKEYIKAAWGKSWISDEFLTAGGHSEKFSALVPQGDNYHSSIGWY